MKINLDIVLKDINGEPLPANSLSEALVEVGNKIGLDNQTTPAVFIRKINDYKNGELTVGLALRRALLERVLAEDGRQVVKVPVDEAQRRFNVANNMVKGGEFNLEDKDAKVVKENMIKMWGPQVTGQIMNYLNPPDPMKKANAKPAGEKTEKKTPESK